MKKFSLSLIIAILVYQPMEAQDIFQAARDNNMALLDKIWVEETNVNQTNSHGFTPLILAVYNESYEVAKFLLEKGANPDVQDSNGNTALMGAAFKGYPKMVDLLLEYKADVNLPNFNNASALLFAATFGQVEIAKKLLEKGADKNVKDNSGKTAWDHAKIQENEVMLQILK